MGERRAISHVPHAGVRCFGPGEQVTGYEPGDFILTRADAWSSRMIRLGQRLRIHGDDHIYSYWDHAAIIVSPGGDLVEVRGTRVLRSHLSAYDDVQRHLVRIAASPAGRAQAVDRAERAAAEEGGGRRWTAPLTGAGTALRLLSGGKFTCGVEGHATTCAGLVAATMERAGAVFDRAPAHMMPADLAKYFRVERLCRPGLDLPPTMGRPGHGLGRPHQGAFPGIAKDDEPVPAFGPVADDGVEFEPNAP